MTTWILLNQYKKFYNLLTIQLNLIENFTSKKINKNVSKEEEKIIEIIDNVKHSNSDFESSFPIEKQLKFIDREFKTSLKIKL